MQHRAASGDPLSVELGAPGLLLEQAQDLFASPDSVQFGLSLAGFIC